MAAIPLTANHSILRNLAVIYVTVGLLVILALVMMLAFAEAFAGGIKSRGRLLVRPWSLAR